MESHGNPAASSAGRSLSARGLGPQRAPPSTAYPRALRGLVARLHHSEGCDPSRLDMPCDGVICSAGDERASPARRSRRRSGTCRKQERANAEAGPCNRGDVLVRDARDSRGNPFARSKRRPGHLPQPGVDKPARLPSSTPSRAEPSRAEPSRAEPSRAEPSRAEPSRAEPSRAEPSRAEPSRAEPSRAEPSRAEPSRAATSASGLRP